MLHLALIEVLPTCVGSMGRVDIGTPKISINRVATILCVASCIIEGVYCGIYPYSKYYPPFG